MPKPRKFMGAYISGADFFKILHVERVEYEAQAWGDLGASARSRGSALGQGKPRARQRWTESPGRGLESQFRLGAEFEHMLLLGPRWSAVRWAKE